MKKFKIFLLIFSFQIFSHNSYADSSGLYLWRYGTYRVIIGPRYDKLREELLKTKEYIQFKTNSSTILSSSYDVLKEYGSAIENGVTDSKLVIEGHTDSRGSEKYNKKLSYRRAKSVKNFLVSFYKISPNRLIVKSYGESKPVSTNMNKKGRALNRRVEFVRIQ